MYEAMLPNGVHRYRLVSDNTTIDLYSTIQDARFMAFALCDAYRDTITLIDHENNTEQRFIFDKQAGFALEEDKVDT